MSVSVMQQAERSCFSKDIHKKVNVVKPVHGVVIEMSENMSSLHLSSLSQTESSRISQVSVVIVPSAKFASQ